VKNECVRDTDLECEKGIDCYHTLAPVIVGGTAYFVGKTRMIQAYKISERKWEILN